MAIFHYYGKKHNVKVAICIYPCRNRRSELSGESHPFGGGGVPLMIAIEPQPCRGNPPISIRSSGIRSSPTTTKRGGTAPRPPPTITEPVARLPPLPPSLPPVNLNRRPSLPSRRRPRRDSLGSTTRPAPPSTASRSNRRCSPPICCR
jgi:hypothetical protein